ncbi:UDP-N-acetylmuramoyl-tripeptide--D-alanyl-D-alanine ligase [bacterium]|nr:UDP-N-acetylmuramoyl-tripeptide--D-alanyl-D-alanine ligase [bacterium]
MFVKFILLFLITILIIIKSKKNLHMLQQNLYNENNRYLKWVLNNSSNFVTIEFISLVMVSLSCCFLTVNKNISFIINIIAIIIYLIFIIKYYKERKEEQVKLPLVVTARIKRLIVTETILYLIPLVILFMLRSDIIYSSYLIFIYALMCYLNVFILFLANFINKYTLEKYVYYHFKHLAMKKLHSMENLKVVGITGSYGKTSSKNILADILNSKYVTLPTPKNLNTPYGLIITINNHLDKFTEVFIAEMGAYKTGEIKQLCDMVKPKYGILTKIGTAHLETFGSEENIQKTKFELIESLPLDGVGVLNKDDPKQVSYKLKNKCKILWIGIENKDVDVHASDIKCSNVGTSFKVKFKTEDKEYSFETKLLGNHNVYNILAGLALGYELGISIDKLQQAVKNIKPVEHRLELKRLGTFYQIDDAYNSNPVGAKGAIDVLAMMPGKRIVVTPGMVELGEKEDYYNEKFGEQIAEKGNIDYVVLIGKKKTLPIKKGLEKKNYNMDNVIVYNNVKEAYNFIRGIDTKDEVYALFENDLPDTYNEKEEG